MNSIKLNSSGENYELLDLVRFIMACLIPFLHIYNENAWEVTKIIEMYFSRLGVPFFFMVSGFFLEKSGEERGIDFAFCKFFKRTLMLLIVWSIIYLPFSIKAFNGISFLREYIFRTPYFLWYLSAALVGGILFVAFHRAKSVLKIILAGVLFGIGTYSGAGYLWKSGNSIIYDLYQKVFITTGNGVFFAFPIMILGGYFINIEKYLQDQFRIA